MVQVRSTDLPQWAGGQSIETALHLSMSWAPYMPFSFH